MAIKKLQNDYTTIEQSKRLLELGVPAWIANIMFDKNRSKYKLISNGLRVSNCLGTYVLPILDISAGKNISYRGDTLHKQFYLSYKIGWFWGYWHGWLYLREEGY